LTPKLGVAGRELIFEEESFSGNLEDLIQNLQTLNNLASNASILNEPGLDKVDVVDEDKGRSIKEDFVFNDVSLRSVDDVEDYKDELDPIYGLDDPNDLIDIKDVVASVTIRVDDIQEGEDKDKDMEIDDIVASVTIRVDDIDKEIPRGEDKDKNEKESDKKGKTNGDVKKNKTEEGGWVWRKKRERSRRQVLDAVLVPCQDHQLCIISGNTELGVVADCGSKELLETNSCHQKDDFFTCVCNSDGCNKSREKAATSIGPLKSHNSEERQNVKSLLGPSEGDLRASANDGRTLFLPFLLRILASMKLFQFPLKDIFL